MKRSSKHSRYTCRSEAQLSLQDQLLETRLRIEQAKLKKLESELPKETPQYTRYEDMPPPSPEDEKRFYENFKKLFHVVALDADGLTDEEVLANLARRRAERTQQKMTNQEIFAAAENELMLSEDNLFQEPPHETDTPNARNRSLTCGLCPF